MRLTAGFDLVGRANVCRNDLVVYTDAGHQGDRGLSSKGQTGVIVCLNGVPIHWRSNRQQATSLSPGEAEVYALSVGVKDARLMGWVLEESGVSVDWPLEINTDSGCCVSFKYDTCPETKMRGCFSYREDWVREVQAADYVHVRKCSDANNLADVFTKCMGPSKFRARVLQIRRFSGVSDFLSSFCSVRENSTVMTVQKVLHRHDCTV